MLMYLRRGLSVIALSVIFAQASKLSAQGTNRECSDSLQRFGEVYDKVEKLVNQDLQKLQKSPAEFDNGLYQEHVKGYEQVVDAGRQHLSSCSNWDSAAEETYVLEGIANGLSGLWQPEDAIPIYKRCLAIDQNSASCWYGLAEANNKLCRFDDAKDAYSKVIAIGGFTENNATDVEAAKLGISNLDTHQKQELMRDVYKCAAESNPAGTGNKRFGSGFFVTKDGYVLTNNHVVEGCKTIATSDGKTLTLVDRRQAVDLALLKANGNTEATAVFRSGPAPMAGDTVYAFGFPLPDILSDSGNVSMGILSATAGINDDVRMIQISAPVQPGNSGGPLLDSGGHVIGVVVAKLDALATARQTGDIPQNVNFAVHWAEVKTFLDEEGISYLRAPSSQKSEPRQVTEQARRYTVKIVCAE